MVEPTNQETAGSTGQPDNRVTWDKQPPWKTGLGQPAAHLGGFRGRPATKCLDQDDL